MHCRMLASISALYPPHTSNNPSSFPSYDNPKSSKPQLSLPGEGSREEESALLRTTVLGGIVPHSLLLTDSQQLLFGCLAGVSMFCYFALFRTAHPVPYSMSSLPVKSDIMKFSAKKSFPVIPPIMTSSSFCHLSIPVTRMLAGCFPRILVSPSRRYSQFNCNPTEGTKELSTANVRIVKNFFKHKAFRSYLLCFFT